MSGNPNGEASQVEPQPQSVHAVENQPGTNDPPYARREWVRIAIEVLTLIAIIGGSWVAYSTLEAINKSVRVAGRSADAAEKAATAAILDQRAWLGYDRYVIEARADDTSRWEEREPKDGEEFRGRLYIQNVGKTPALNVQVTRESPTMIPVDSIPEEPQEWSITTNKFVVFPNDDGFSQSTIPYSMSDQDFSNYSSRSIQAFIWAKLYYCDTTGRRHWTQTGIVHLFEAREFLIAASSVSPDPVEPNHPDCQK